MKYLFILITVVSAAASADQPRPQPCADGAAPRAAVMGYLTAMHKHRFDDAYDFVTSAMTDGRPRADWSALQARAYQPGKVDIYGVDVRAVMASADDPECNHVAIVPNVLSSRDRLNEHGSVEFEIYTVRKEDGVWLIHGQETLFDDAGINTWFPETRALDSAN